MKAVSFSLSELNGQISEVVSLHFKQAVWIRAEISELHEHGNGHAYLELVEKTPQSERLLAKSRASCWANVYRMLKPYFEHATGEQLRRGLKILVLCSVEYHELYGLNLNIRDIEPSFTIGDLALQRMEIIRRLESDGVMEMNKMLPLSDTPQRIAVISSATAAGYGDFVHQLENNENGFVFYLKLFPATMQGEHAAESVLRALEAIFAHIESFDAVAIVRGGGASTDLSCFDNYELAFHCAQFPLPIITGIGHERDQSVIDLVAHTHCKTPTAVAEFFIRLLQRSFLQLSFLEQSLKEKTLQHINQEYNLLKNNQIRLSHEVERSIFRQKSALDFLYQKLRSASWKRIQVAAHRLDLAEQSVQLFSPEKMLARGFTLTTKGGKIVRQSSSLQSGERITTHFSDGNVESTTV